jgi:hypothetical protein
MQRFLIAVAKRNDTDKHGHGRADAGKCQSVAERSAKQIA